MKKHLLGYALVVSSVFLFSLCRDASSREMDKILMHAGKNKEKLQKVLKHYTCPQDSLKYRAACFLIRNMPDHFSYADTAYTRKFYQELDSVYRLGDNQSIEISDSLFRSVGDKYPPRREYISDLEFVSAQYLIDNIDKAFDVWHSDWARHVDFDAFCEYLLPYKVVDLQELDDWRDYFLHFCDGDLRDYKYCDAYRYSAYKASKTVNLALTDSVPIRLVFTYHLSVNKMNELAKIPFGFCDDYCLLSVSVMRAKGIPCAIDFTPQWPYYAGHSWCVVLLNSGKHFAFEGANATYVSPHNNDYKMPKIFRRVFASNPEIKDICRSEAFVPEIFRLPFIRDVTEEYMKTVDLKLKTPKRTGHEYAYLAVFDNQYWIPIHWGKIKGNRVVFDKMGKDIVYLPVFYGAGGVEPFSDPFLLTTQGEVVPLRADTLSKQILTLFRKFPPLEPQFNISKRIVGGKFQASNDPSFASASTITVHEVKDRGLIAREVLLDSLSGAYRYWRYCSPRGGHCNIAEILFYGEDSLFRVSGNQIIGTEGTSKTVNGIKYTKETVFDGDALTYFDAPSPDDGWVGVDFKKPVHVNKIIYLPRNDGNCIEIGDVYELFYWGDHRWQSLGKTTADNTHLVFDNCPVGALFLLHNHTKGIQERRFTYENGEQIWW